MAEDAHLTRVAAALVSSIDTHASFIVQAAARFYDRRLVSDQHESQPKQPEKPRLTRAARGRARIAAIQAKKDRLALRAQDERSSHRSVDVLFEVADRDAEVGGGIMAGALAYRLFIMLLPLTLVAIAGLGIAADASSTSPREAADTLGLAGLASSSVADAANSSTRWYALLVGIPILLVAMRSTLRTLFVIHRLVWTDVRSEATRPSAVQTLQFLVALLVYLSITAVSGAVTHASALAGIAGVVIVWIPYAVLWLVISIHLPHRESPWSSLIPGAILLGVGIQVIQALTTYFIVPTVDNKQGTYGSLGIAAAMLLGLFFVSRLLVATAVLNATLWDRRVSAPSPEAPTTLRDTGPPPPRPGPEPLRAPRTRAQEPPDPPGG